MRRRLWTLLAAAALALPGAAADPPAKDKEPKAPAPAAPDPCAELLAKDLTALSEALPKSGAYAVTAEGKWKTEGAGPAAEGTNRYEFVFAPPGKFRITAGSAKEGALVCVSDGKTVLTVHEGRKLYAAEPAKRPLEALADNTLLNLTLAGAGLEFLARPNPAAALAGRAGRVLCMGEVDLDGKKARQYRLRGDAADVDLWFAAEGPPVIRRVQRVVKVPVGDKEFKSTATADLTWQLDAKPADGAFAAEPPKDAKQVEDVYAALTGAESLLGKAAPALELKLHGGGDLALAGHKGKDVVALVFWATWAAPSLDDLASVSKFVKAYADKGVVFYAVNTGERPEAVDAFVKRVKPESKIVLDPKAAGAEAFGVTRLPAVVLLGKDGTVQAVRTRDPAALEPLGKDLDALLAGKSLTGK